mgnify:CR=1 FL=1
MTAEARRHGIDLVAQLAHPGPRRLTCTENPRRALFVARGDLFSVPVEKGLAINLTGTSNAHEREVAWSPDGTRIAFTLFVPDRPEPSVQMPPAAQSAQWAERAK